MRNTFAFNGFANLVLAATPLDGEHSAGDEQLPCPDDEIRGATLLAGGQEIGRKLVLSR